MYDLTCVLHVLCSVYLSQQDSVLIFLFHSLSRTACLLFLCMIEFFRGIIAHHVETQLNCGIFNPIA
jgi:phage-related holin